MKSLALRSRTTVAVAVMAASAFMLTACTSSTAPGDSTSAAPTRTPDVGAQHPVVPPVVPTPDPAAVFVPGGTAEENLPIFTKVVLDQWAAGSGTRSAAYIDALVATGFDLAAMETTASKTTLGNDVESLQFSVLIQGTCLVGQVGASTGDPVAVLLPELKDGGCLVAVTPQPGT
ncbi:hypothetical protein [Microbacterium sp. NC79]|uniref:DUF6993 domain-containing protein n=1 Tax=Microbacterium sp. NC79 TaxID=2851009 RepID=UPI00349F39D5